MVVKSNKNKMTALAHDSNKQMRKKTTGAADTATMPGAATFLGSPWKARMSSILTGIRAWDFPARERSRERRGV